MKCENGFCVYEKDGVCLLDRIELDTQGQCKECIYVPIDPDVLAAAKTAALQSLGDGYLRKNR